MATEPIHPTKPCSKCGVEKPKTTAHFSPLKKARDGLHSWCKVCLAAWRREDRAKNKARYTEIERRRYERHGETRRDANRQIWAKRSEVYRRNAKPRVEAKREDYNEARRAKYAADPDMRRQRSDANRKWCEENAESLKEMRRLKWQQATPTQRLRSYFGAAIAHALKGSGKGGKGWQQLVGYTATDLKRHLERQFIKGMSWDNYGEWHVDHIIPVASFTFTTPDDPDFKACWALTNLRPLWSGDNIRKSDNRLHLI